jgi:hypothetical protein
VLGEHLTGPQPPHGPDTDARAIVPAQVLMAAGAGLCLISLVSLFLVSMPCASVMLGLTGLLGGLLGLTLTRSVLATSPPHPWEPHADLATSDASPPHGLVAWGDTSLWYIEQPRVWNGAHIGTRMAILTANGSGDLLVYAPTALPTPLVRSLSALGEIRWVVFAHEQDALTPPLWLDSFPDAERWTPSRILSSPPPTWDPSFVEGLVLRGDPQFEETILFHKPSLTLVVQSAILNLGHGGKLGWLDLWGLKLLGMDRRPGPSIDRKWTTRNRADLSEDASTVAAWPFERIFLAHGHLIDHRSQEAWRDAYAFVNHPETAVPNAS